MKCPECQSEKREGARFCNECGHKFEILCPGCGNRNRTKSKFCGECGHDVTKPAKPLPNDYKQPQSYTPKFPAHKTLTIHTFIMGDRKLVAVLFAGVTNNTPMADTLDPKKAHQIAEGPRLERRSGPGYLFLGELYTGRKEGRGARDNLRAAEMFEAVGMDYRPNKAHEVPADL